MYKFFRVAVLAASLSLAAPAQTPNDVFAGTWKLDVAKSKFSPGPAPKSATVTIGQDGKVDFQGESANGQAEKWSVTMSEGKPAPISGMEGSTVTAKSINERTVEHSWKYPDATSTGKAVLAKNGKSFTYTMTGKSADGKPVNNREVWDKE